MARTESIEGEVGSKAPNFTLLEPMTQSEVSLDVAAPSTSAAVLVLFICNHCPFVLAVIDQLNAIAKEYSEQGVATIAISSNSTKTHPQDGPEEMAKFAVMYGLKFPYLFDESQQVARDYGAVCTPDIFLYDNSRKLQYRGQLDASRPSNGKIPTGADLRKAIDLVLKGQPVPDQTPSIGCSIKWHP